MKTSVISVLYASADVVSEMVAAVPLDCELILVDNASPDEALRVALALRPDATYARLGQNRGFGAGCNAGAALATGDVLIFLNPDARPEPDAISLLAAAVRAQPRRLVGPAILGKAGDVLHVCRRRSRVLHDVVDLLGFLRAAIPESLRRDISPGSEIYSHGGSVDYLQGACLAVSRDFFSTLRGFDESFFLYFEEEDLCDRAHRLGGTCMYLPTAKVGHLWGTSTGRTTSVAAWHHFRSAVLIHRKRGNVSTGVFAATAFLGAVLLRLCVVVPLSVLKRRDRGISWTVAAGGGAVAGVIARGSRRLPALRDVRRA